MRVKKVDPALRRAFNAYYATLDPGPLSSLEPPVKGIAEVQKRYGVGENELKAWRFLAFPLYNVKGRNQQEKWYANPERVQAWFRWRDLIQSGAIVVDPTAPDSVTSK